MDKHYKKGFMPYGAAAFLVGVVGGFSTVLGPAFVQALGISYSNTTWTALAQAMSTAACAPILGKLGGALGRKAALLLGILVFTLGNVLTAIASSLIFMLLARFIVGVGTATIAPVVMSYIVTEFPSGETAKGFSWYMLISSSGVILGPTLGGIMVQTGGWRAMTWVCVAICVLVFLVCLCLLRKTKDSPKPLVGFDGLEAFLVLVFFSLVLCIPSFGQNFGWRSAPFTAVLAATLIFLVCLILAEKRAASPILPGSFMGRRVFILSVLALFLTQGLMQANMTNTIVFVNYTQPQNTLISGYAISIMYLGMSLGSVILGPQADRHEPKLVLICSLGVTLLGCGAMLFFSPSTPAVLLMASLGLLGFGLGGNGSIFMKIVLSGLSLKDAGAGTGTYGLFRDLAAPFGVAVLVPLFTVGIANRMEAGASQQEAAVETIRQLGLIEIFCIAAGIAIVGFLPRIHKKERLHETER